MLHLVTSGTYILCLPKLNTVYMGFVQSYLKNIVRRRFGLDSYQILNSPDGEAKVAEHKDIYTTSLHAARLKT